MVNGKPLNCDQVYQEVSDYLEGEIDPGLRAALDVHFAACAPCKSVLDGVRNVMGLYGDERMIQVPAGYSRRLEKRLAQNARVSQSRWSTWSAWLVPVAALALFAGGLRFANSITFNPPMKDKLAQRAHDIPPDMLVIVSTGAKVFHVAGCPFIHDKDKERTLTAKEAMREGYVPCVRCMRKYLETALAGPTSFGLAASAASDADDDDDLHGAQ
jgi:hypothetical protein